MNDWYLYIIETRLGHLYTGVTTDVSRRFQEHSAGGARGAKALRGKGPLILLASVNVGSKSIALKYERKVKSLTARQKHRLTQSNDLAQHFQSWIASTLEPTFPNQE